MKRKEWLKRYFLAIVLGAALVTSSIPVGATQTDSVQTEIAEETAETSSEDDSEENVIEISTPAGLVAVAEKCSYDNWSLDKTIRLTADINMSDIEFSGIPYFNGVFDGNGYEIRQLRFEPQGSEYGFFRYIGESGVVKDLTLSAVIAPSGSQEYIGGLVGVNYGTIIDCSFEGSVEGLNYVGAVAGSNKATGKIFSCSNSAIVMATNYTGGIVGINEGLISGCSSKSSINTEELETTMDLGGIDIGTLNFTQTLVNRNDMGGIAGISTGVISDCKNQGTIGYKHTGYNVGGIVGGQSGIVLNCTNEGKVYGRKDVGGIVGQAKPYVESEYLEDKVEQTQADISRLNNTLNNLSATMSQTSAEVKRQTDSLNQQYKDSVQNISNSLGTLSDAAQGNPETQGYVDNINAALENIEGMQPSESGNLSQEQLDQIQNNLNSITDNLGNL